MAKWTLQNEIDKAINALLPVIVKGDKDLEAKIASLGSRIGSFTGWDNRPSTDGMGNPVSVNDTFRLTEADGNHPAGLYARKPDNSDWEDTPFLNFDDLKITQIIEDAKADLTPDWMTDADGFPTSDIDNKFTTPKQVVQALTIFKNKLTELYHPKGGDESLKAVGADADENTQEFITAKQASVTYNVADLEAQYNTLYNQ